MHDALEAVMHSAPRATGALHGLLRSLLSSSTHSRPHVRRSPCMVCTPPSCVVERGGRTMASLHPDPPPHSPSPQRVPRSPPPPPSPWPQSSSRPSDSRTTMSSSVAYGVSKG